MPATDLSLLNAALTRTGSDPIASLSDTSPGGIIADLSYEQVVKNELSLHPYKPATKIKQLTRLDEDEEGDPPEPWTAAYQLPTDLIDIRTVMISGQTIPYAVHGDTILCDAGEADEVILHYVWRIPETAFPPWLKEGITLRMEAIFLRGIGERYREAAARDAAADDQFAKARNRDSQSQTPRAPVTSPTLAARRGTPGSTGGASTWMEEFGS